MNGYLQISVDGRVTCINNIHVGSVAAAGNFIECIHLQDGESVYLKAAGPGKETGSATLISPCVSLLSKFLAGTEKKQDEEDIG